MNTLVLLALVILAASLVGIGLLYLLALSLRDHTNASRTPAEDEQQKLWDKQGRRTAQRTRALQRAKMTGNYDEYNALKETHAVEFRIDMARVVDLEVGISDRDQAELDAGINPYKSDPAPSGRTARVRR